MSDNDKPQFETARGTLGLASENSTPADPMQAAEARMRRALGLEGDQPRTRPSQDRTDSPQRPGDRFIAGGHKRRFVHDGEVPVQLVHGLVPGRRDNGDANGARNGGNGQPTNRLEVAEAALAAEIATRERSERALHEAQAAVHDLQTKVGHADLARQEAVEALRRERETMAELRAALHAAEEQVMEVREAQQKAERALTALQDRRAGDTEPVVRARRGRKPRAAFATSLVDADVMDDPTADDLALDDLAADDLAADDRALDDRAAHDMVPDDIVFAVGSLLQRGGDFAPLVERPRRGRKPKPKVVYEALPIADDDDGVVVVPGQSAAAKRSRSSDPAQPREPKAPREPKPIRWWLTPRAKKQR